MWLEVEISHWLIPVGPEDRLFNPLEILGETCLKVGFFGKNGTYSASISEFGPPFNFEIILHGGSGSKSEAILHKSRVEHSKQQSWEPIFSHMVFYVKTGLKHTFFNENDPDSASISEFGSPFNFEIILHGGSG